MDNPHIARFAVINNGTHAILGKDLAGVFDAGCVYEATKVGDEVLLRNIGPYAMTDSAKDTGTGHGNQSSHIMLHGSHLLTRDEWAEATGK
jgi:hypothetical protein